LQKALKKCFYAFFFININYESTFIKYFIKIALLKMLFKKNIVLILLPSFVKNKKHIECKKRYSY